MKIELGKEYETRDGREVRIYAVDGDDRFPVHGAIRYDGYWSLEVWTEDGKSIVGDHKISSDLIEKPKTIKGEVWVVVKRDGSARAILPKDGMPVVRLPNDRALIRIPFECKEGQFDE